MSAHLKFIKSQGNLMHSGLTRSWWRAHAPSPPSAASAVRRFRWLLLTSTLFAGAALAQSADLVINHADSPDPGPAGGIFTYTLRIDNNGPNGASGVTLTDTIPAGSTFVDVTTTAGSCGEAGGVVNCTLGNIPFNANQTVTIRVRLPSAGVWTNSATAGSATSDPNTSNNVNNIQDTTATQAADLAVTAIPSASSVAGGQAFSYGLHVVNNGPDAADGGQRITFTVPSGASITGVPAGTNWSCSPSSGYPLSSGTVVCTRSGSLANGAAAAQLTVPAVANVNGTVTAAFAVAGLKSDGSAMPDGNAANNTSAVDVTSTNGVDVSITKAANAANVAVGDNVVYTLTPRLNGGVSLLGQPITVIDTLGAGLTFVSATGSGWTCDATVTCTRAEYTGSNFSNMPAITVTATATLAGTVGNTASITTLVPDPVPGNNLANVNVTASNDADMRLAKTASINPVVPNVPFNYTLTARNLGPLAVPVGQNITITDQVPAGVTLSSAVSTAGWTCGALPVTGPTAWSCTRSDGLAVNVNASPVTVSAVLTSAGTATNNACVALGAGVRTDNNPTNDCAGVGVTATVTGADLRLVSKTAAPNPVVAGQDLTYIITVDNQGPDPATNVMVTDGLTSLLNTGGFQSAVASQGSCTPNSATNGTSQTLSCNLGTLNSGSQATVTLVVRPSIAVTGMRTNTASVTSPDVGDPVPGNNSATVTSQVTAAVDLTAAKTATPLSVPAGAPITFVATVRNNGPSTAQNVQAVDNLPTNAAFISASASGGGSCTTPAVGARGGTLTCTWASLNSGSQNTITYQLRPLGTAIGGNVVNTVSVSTTTAESNTANNSATTTTAVTAAQLDILVNKVDSSDPVDLGQPTTYTITVNNSGPSFGTNVVLTDIFPAPGSSPTATFSYQGSLTVNAGGSCSQPAIGAISGTLICSFPGLASGQSATVTYVMRAEALTVGGATSGTAFNQASVTVDEPETLLANNVVAHDTTARRFTVATDLALSKTAPAGPLPPGAALAYTLVVTNNGPLPSDGAQILDVLPVGLTFISAPGCVEAVGKVTCNVGSLVVGASRTFTVNTTLASPYTGAHPLVNTATVDAPGDTNPANNASTATTTVTTPPSGVNSIPTLSQWGLIVLSAILGLLTFRVGARNRRW
ncbi:IPTL-CTERM sorting domain-containing protein [Acidovorax delafieldii]|nr:IPTL-CTERM sorting domain-containing protein [Acidovorax delafieldii]